MRNECLLGCIAAEVMGLVTQVAGRPPNLLCVHVCVYVHTYFSGRSFFVRSKSLPPRRQSRKSCGFWSVRELLASVQGVFGSLVPAFSLLRAALCGLEGCNILPLCFWLQCTSFLLYVHLGPRSVSCGDMQVRNFGIFFFHPCIVLFLCSLYVTRFG